MIIYYTNLSIICLTITFSINLSAKASSLFEDHFISSDDGYLDMSDWLASKHGFLPVPIIITEPAVGAGGGIALSYFHGDLKGREAENGSGRRVPPSISVMAGAKTSNGTQFVGGGHLGIWDDDKVRYTGFVADAKVVMDYYGRGNSAVEDDPMTFNLDTRLLVQKLMMRITDSDFFVGGEYLFLDTESRFNTANDQIPGVGDRESSSRATAFSILASYDSRDNLFAPKKGTIADIKAMFFDEAFGGDENFERYRLRAIHFINPHPEWVFGLRADISAIGGSAPYYAYPFINMRGVEAMRYQGSSTGLLEAEANWQFHPRFSAIGFTGSGKAQNKGDEFSDSDNITTFGMGARYYIAKALGLQVGIDFAHGPDGDSVYVSFGSGLVR